MAAYNLFQTPQIQLLKLESNGQWISHTSGVNLVSSCNNLDGIQLIPGNQNLAHILAHGSGGCGMSVEYAWWDGSAWQGHPSLDTLPMQVSGYGWGKPAFSMHGNQTVIALAENIYPDHEFLFWTWDSDSWVFAMPALVFPGLLSGNEKVSMELVHAPDGRLCTAIHMDKPLEPDPFSLIRVFCEDPDSGQWVELANGMDPDKHTRHPSLVFAGDQLYMAFSQKEEVVVNLETRELWRARVVRWNPVALTWETVGTVPVYSDIQEIRQLQLVNQEDQLVLFLLEVWHEEPEGLFRTGSLYVTKP